MSENKLYYIYIDTKIPGALEQLVSYFQAQIFEKGSCINVLCKYYKEIETLFSSVFNKNDIPFLFIKRRSDLNLIEGKTVFYLFNAQSNCRMVAYRDLTHIFVTHGESHKLASIKPIIRIYDYVITSGVVGIERYLKSGVFTEYDIKNERVLSLGDTFIGNNSFCFSSESKALVYAPTWEGGVPEENYCSISQCTAYKIIDFCNKEKIGTICIQPHPNLGHRDINYKKELNKMISLFKRNALRVIIISRDINRNLSSVFNLFSRNDNKSHISVKFALTDISAMEMQFYRNGIPYAVLVNKESLSTLSIPSRMNEYYSRVFISEEKDIVIDSHDFFADNELKRYLLSYHQDGLHAKNFRERIEWLCDFTASHKKNALAQLQKTY